MEAERKRRDEMRRRKEQKERKGENQLSEEEVTLQETFYKKAIVVMSRQLGSYSQARNRSSKHYRPSLVLRKDGCQWRIEGSKYMFAIYNANE